MNRTLLLLCFIIVTTQFAAGQDTCQVLALEGGGSNGAYEAGALYGLINGLPAEDVRYQAVSGISTGTLNSIGFATHTIGDEVGAVNFLQDLWSQVDQNDVWSSWPLGVVQGWFTEGGIYNSSALGDYLEAQVPANYTARSVYMGTDNLINGEFTLNYNKAMPTREDYLYAVRSSGAAPLFFPPINWESPIGPQTDTDGGTKMNLNVLSAIRHCILEGYDESDIYIDAVMCFNPGQIPSFNPETQNSLNMIQYVIHMFGYNFNNYYIKEVMNAYPQSNFRYLMYPLKPIPSNNPIAPLNFTHDHLMGLLEMGKSDAAEFLSWGPGTSWNTYGQVPIQNLEKND